MMMTVMMLVMMAYKFWLWGHVGYISIYTLVFNVIRWWNSKLVYGWPLRAMVNLGRWFCKYQWGKGWRKRDRAMLRELDFHQQKCHGSWKSLNITPKMRKTLSSSKSSMLSGSIVPRYLCVGPGRFSQEHHAVPGWCAQAFGTPGAAPCSWGTGSLDGSGSHVSHEKRAPGWLGFIGDVKFWSMLAWQV